MRDKWVSEEELRKLLGDEVPEAVGAQEDVPEAEGIHYEEVDQNVEIKGLNLEEFLEPTGAPGKKEAKGATFETIHDVPLEVRVLLGEIELTIEELLSLEVDSIVKLHKNAGEPVEIVVGTQMIAKGEIVIIDEKFGVLITEIVSPRERINTVKRKLIK